MTYGPLLNYSPVRRSERRARPRGVEGRASHPGRYERICARDPFPTAEPDDPKDHPEGDNDMIFNYPLLPASNDTLARSGRARFGRLPRTQKAMRGR